MRRLACLLVLGVLLAGCGAAESGDALASASAIVVSSDLAPGRARLLVGLVGPDGTRLGSPHDEVAIEIAPADRPDLRSRAPGAFTWIIEGGIGLYRAEFQIDAPGQYVATVVPDGGLPLEPVPFTVNPETFAPGIGDLAPLTPTPTLSGNALEAISTDPDPDPSFYAMSLDEAVSSGRPTVAVFSTPGFCVTTACGPMLDLAKEVAPGYPEVHFVHVEIYEGFDEADFSPDPAHLAPAVTAGGWNLPTEPWVFVVDAFGIVTDRFEGVMDPAELREALGPPVLTGG